MRQNNFRKDKRSQKKNNINNKQNRFSKKREIVKFNRYI